jgi:hypothetical protein
MANGKQYGHTILDVHGHSSICGCSDSRGGVEVGRNVDVPTRLRRCRALGIAPLGRALDT